MNVLELRVTDSHTVQLNHQNYTPMDQILRVAAFHTPSETQIGGWLNEFLWSMEWDEMNTLTDKKSL